MARQFKWDADNNLVEKNRPLCLSRPCECGCDFRDGNKGAGYISGSVKGKGFTLWIEDKEIFERVEKAFKKAGLSIRNT